MSTIRDNSFTFWHRRRQIQVHISQTPVQTRAMSLLNSHSFQSHLLWIHSGSLRMRLDGFLGCFIHWTCSVRFTPFSVSAVHLGWYKNLFLIKQQDLECFMNVPSTSDSILCVFSTCRMEKLHWRRCIHGRTEPRASCVTSARETPTSRACTFH